MKQFNFLPKYKDWILEGSKFRTVRYGDKYYKKFRIGDKMSITIGGNTGEPEKIATAKITELVLKKIKEIKKQDVIGDPEAWPKSSLVTGLSEIYSKRIGRNVKEDDIVTIVKFKVIE